MQTTFHARDIRLAGGLADFKRKLAGKELLGKLSVKAPGKCKIDRILDPLTLPHAIQELLADDRIKLVDKISNPNKWEERYCEEWLDPLTLEGQLLWFEFEPFKIELAYRCTLTVDYFSFSRNGFIFADDIKGFLRDDANVKIKVAARMFPHITFRFAALKGRQWTWKEVRA